MHILAQINLSSDNSEEQHVIRKILTPENFSYGDSVLSEFEDIIPYNPDVLLDDKQIYVLNNFSKEKFAKNLDINISSSAYNEMTIHEWNYIEFLIMMDEKYIYFQNIGKTALLGKRSFWYIGGNFQFDNSQKRIVIKDVPDAIYDKANDALYFCRINMITKMFPGIEDLYKEATQGEVVDFLNSSFIKLIAGFAEEKVKTTNRKRIALIKNDINLLDPVKQKEAIKYISHYCPKLEVNNGIVSIRSDKELKMLLYGLQGRYYTTPIKKEKRLANSVIKLGN